MFSGENVFLFMEYFDFHYHRQPRFGIYNVDAEEKPQESSFSIGLHPKDITENWKVDWENIKKKTLLPNCMAIGECGLDTRVDADLATQYEVFKTQVLWANQIHKPVIVHCVRAFHELLKIAKIANTALIVHGFNKKQEIASMLLTHGFYLSFGEAVLHHVSLQNVLKKTPLKKLFLESDTADFDISELYEKVAMIKQITVEELQKQIMQNLNTVTLI